MKVLLSFAKFLFGLVKLSAIGLILVWWWQLPVQIHAPEKWGFIFLGALIGAVITRLAIPDGSEKAPTSF